LRFVPTSCFRAPDKNRIRSTCPERYLPTSGFHAKHPEHGRRITHAFSRRLAFARNFRHTTGGLLTFCLDFRFSRKLPKTRRRTSDPAHTPSALLADFRFPREGEGTAT
jgi:hypothetical protein